MAGPRSVGLANLGAPLSRGIWWMRRHRNFARGPEFVAPQRRGLPARAHRGPFGFLRHRNQSATRRGL